MSIEYELETNVTGVLINVTEKESSYGKFSLLRVKCGFEGQSQVTVLLPPTWIDKVTMEDLGRPVYCHCYSNENDFGGLNHTLRGLRWLD